MYLTIKSIPNWDKKVFNVAVQRPLTNRPKTANDSNILTPMGYVHGGLEHEHIDKGVE